MLSKEEIISVLIYALQNGLKPWQHSAVCIFNLYIKNYLIHPSPHSVSVYNTSGETFIVVLNNALEEQNLYIYIELYAGRILITAQGNQCIYFEQEYQKILNDKTTRSIN